MVHPVRTQGFCQSACHRLWSRRPPSVQQPTLPDVSVQLCVTTETKICETEIRKSDEHQQPKTKNPAEQVHHVRPSESLHVLSFIMTRFRSMSGPSGSRTVSYQQGKSISRVPMCPGKPGKQLAIFPVMENEREVVVITQNVKRDE